MHWASVGQVMTASVSFDYALLLLEPAEIDAPNPDLLEETVAFDEAREHENHMPVWRLIARTAKMNGLTLQTLDRLHSQARGERYHCRCSAATGSACAP